MEAADLRQRLSRVVESILIAYADDEKVFRWLCNGALDYLLKKTPPARLLK